MMNMIRDSDRNEAIIQSTDGIKENPICISPSPPIIKKQEPQQNEVNEENHNGNDKYYRKLIARFGQKEEYDIDERVQFFIPSLAATNHFVNRFGVITAKNLPFYDVTDEENTMIYHDVDWFYILRPQPLIAHNLHQNDNNCIQNDNESTNLSIGISPISTNDNLSFQSKYVYVFIIFIFCNCVSIIVIPMCRN